MNMIHSIVKILVKCETLHFLKVTGYNEEPDRKYYFCVWSGNDRSMLRDLMGHTGFRRRNGVVRLMEQQFLPVYSDAEPGDRFLVKGAAWYNCVIWRDHPCSILLDGKWTIDSRVPGIRREQNYRWMVKYITPLTCSLARPTHQSI